MKNVIILAAAATLVLAAPVLAQSTSGSQSSGRSDTIIRTPPSTSNGTGSGTSGSVGSPTPNYPGRVRDFNNPSTTDFNIRNRAIGVPRR
ncbi:MAG: hypothetical protein JSS54_02035 [Proteobacteria bacterium]|nr:hypothetical protein [Pseudomonadota bacterium]MBS0267737.1 hypothetical protein [Pseudomonadota bacterium]